MLDEGEVDVGEVGDPFDGEEEAGERDSEGSVGSDDGACDS